MDFLDFDWREISPQNSSKSAFAEFFLFSSNRLNFVFFWVLGLSECFSVISGSFLVYFGPFLVYFGPLLALELSDWGFVSAGILLAVEWSDWVLSLFLSLCGLVCGQVAGLGFGHVLLTQTLRLGEIWKLG